MNEFQRRFNRLAKNRTDRELAQMMHISEPAIRRWRAGTVTPHHMLQRSVYDTLEEANGAFLLDWYYVREQAREAFRSYFLPVTFIVKCIKSAARYLRKKLC